MRLLRVMSWQSKDLRFTGPRYLTSTLSASQGRGEEQGDDEKLRRVIELPTADTFEAIIRVSLSVCPHIFRVQAWAQRSPAWEKSQQ